MIETEPTIDVIDVTDLRTCASYLSRHFNEHLVSARAQHSIKCRIHTFQADGESPQFTVGDETN